MPLFALFELFLDDGAKEHDEPDAEKRAKDAEEEIQPVSLARGISKDEDDGCKEGDDGEDDEEDFERPEGAQLLARLFRSSLLYRATVALFCSGSTPERFTSASKYSSALRSRAPFKCFS